jgi:hypothetical protein
MAAPRTKTEKPRPVCQGRGVTACKYAAKGGSKYCGLHTVWERKDEIEARGGKVCSNFKNYSCRCANEVAADDERLTCTKCREKGKISHVMRRQVHDERWAKAQARCPPGMHVCRTLCTEDPQDRSLFVETPGNCEPCWARQNVIEKTRKEKEKKKKAEGIVTNRAKAAREYEHTTERQESKKARKEAQPEWYKAQYSKYSAKRKNLTYEISAEAHIQLCKESCFFCLTSPNSANIVISRLDTKVGMTEDNVRPCCKTCLGMKGNLDARTFVKRCVFLTELADGGACAYPQHLYAEHPTSGNYYDSKKKARLAGREFELTTEEYEDIRSNPCYICGKTDSDSHRNGLDRVDSAIGYTVENVAACCESVTS